MTDPKVREALEALGRCVSLGGTIVDYEGQAALATLTALVESEAGLRAENERLKAEVERMRPSCLTCFGTGKILTHPTIICPKCGGTGKEWSVAWKARAEKAEAELARWKPLIEAAEGADVFAIEIAITNPTIESWQVYVLRAVLACQPTPQTDPQAGDVGQEGEP